MNPNPTSSDLPAILEQLLSLARQAETARSCDQHEEAVELGFLDLLRRHEPLLRDELPGQRELLATFPCCWEQLVLLARSELSWVLDSYSELYTEGWAGSELPPEFFALRNLEAVSFSGCDLESIAGEYSKLGRLRSVVAEEVWNLPFLDDPSPATAPAIEEIHIAACNFEVFPVQLYQARSLKRLTFAYCHNGDYLTRPFTEIPSGLANLHQLEELDLAGIGLRRLPDDLFGMTWLKKLNLYSSDLPSAIKVRLRESLAATEILLDGERESDDYES